MDGFYCDRCGKGLLLEESVRYVVSIDVRAAYDPMEISRADLAGDLRGRLRSLGERLERLSAEEAQDEVHRAFRFDLCPPCQKAYLQAPVPGQQF